MGPDADMPFLDYTKKIFDSFLVRSEKRRKKKKSHLKDYSIFCVFVCLFYFTDAIILKKIILKIRIMC